ncbi:hypothetical protein ACFV8Z_12080 [Streptomyces sp. NPDC059837]|uniref:hypothetical protein n=1 Tax=unclassified Streptomyces TaxID=2593676 RepID=UPI0022513113|nr:MULTISPECIES: hypothetical protein [unclassified Streptomyces]MCX4411267.1 hypothetical protein [Streptomyces sp. NBC_01764]MCX5192274.1 hypothetical protein [Streptomyces sp. NBC_00268]
MSQILEGGGVDAVQVALEDFAGQVSEDELNAAADLSCKVIGDDPARIKARGDRDQRRTGWQRKTAERAWQLNNARTRHSRTCSRGFVHESCGSGSSSVVGDVLSLLDIEQRDGR